jgi:hypothetical protein
MSEKTVIARNCHICDLCHRRRGRRFFLSFFAAAVTKRPLISLYDSGQAIRPADEHPDPKDTDDDNTTCTT